MSITEELRAWASTEVPYKYGQELLAIADRIDMAHKHAIGYVDDRDPETMAENGWVKLPVDADGVPIRVGDVMENVVNPSIHRRVAGVGAECFYAWEDGFGRYSQFDAPNYRHHHEPTVEDVLREFLCVFMGKREFDGDAAEAISEYAAKLRLVGDAE